MVTITAAKIPSKATATMTDTNVIPREKRVMLYLYFVSASESVIFAGREDFRQSFSVRFVSRRYMKCLHERRILFEMANGSRDRISRFNIRPHDHKWRPQGLFLIWQYGLFVARF